MGKKDPSTKSSVERSQSSASISSLIKSPFRKQQHDDGKQHKLPQPQPSEIPEPEQVDQSENGPTEESDLTLEEYRSKLKEQSSTLHDEPETEQQGILNRFGFWGKQQDSWTTWTNPLWRSTEQPNDQPDESANTEQAPAKGWFGWSWMGANNQNSHEQQSAKSIENERAEIAAEQLSNFGPSLARTTSWAFWNGSQNSNGLLSIFGTSSGNSPVRCETVPKTQYETQESSLSKLTTSETPVVPELTYNYRDLTKKTQLRLIVSKISPFPLVKPETHLYHDSTYTQELPVVETKKALAISVHGFLPFKMVKSLVGQSTGSADYMAEATKSSLVEWGNEHNVNLEIETLALDGSGRILERVNNCLVLLLDNWLDSILNCDYLFVTSHSQTVPVAVHIISRLITAGYADKIQKIGLINLSGICLGPHSGLDSKLSVRAYSNFESDVLMELFDFQDDETAQSKELVRHMEILLRKNVKITFVGSLDDQFVPLYSSLCTHINHPNIYRCAYLKPDTPDFIRKLVELVLLMRNLGFDDHELLVELNTYLQGAPGTGSYGDILQNKNVYRAGIANTLETSNLLAQQDLQVRPINVKKFHFNQYHLPWCLRGFLQETLKLRNFPTKTLLQDLVDAYQEWDPQQKQLKDFKYTLEILSKSPIEELCND
ncbi:hypothetical protein OGAPHI_006900 [Ogataea philodendri]|uniref:YMC020W-like alpha/beta hydrolase domain-containing protein n=1 Tax=Ogataea philodendri TaxID=1378263 RepID=A0A9P8NWG8_9ASCO|nr:uncharacterized protein OGAPHI_006900 [Ogataea philodendri]KAH3660314.1 hypothetical protein OGAPHI_006900 [Ogataea philodendri]